jgi:hypothetical protein
LLSVCAENAPRSRRLEAAPWQTSAVCGGLLCLFALAAVGQARDPLPTEPPRPLGLVGTVLGIVEYSRWPGAARGITLCIAGNGPQSMELAAAIASGPAGASGARPLQTRVVAPQPAALAGCDVVFFEAWKDAEQHEALAMLASRPVLTMGTGTAFCSSGGLFCLQPGAGNVRFAVNTDAVARSGLLVNPRVLQLGRRAAAP